MPLNSSKLLAAAWMVLVCVAHCLAAEPGPKEPLSGPKPKPITPPTKEEVQQSITRGVNYLLETQNPHGSWGSAHRTKDLNIFAPVPGAHEGFRAAVTAMAISALIESEDPRTEVQDAIKKGEEWLLDNLDEVRRGSSVAIYNVWAHAYGIEALVKMHARHKDEPELRKRIELLVVDQYDRLTRYESVDGGWGYYDFRGGAKRPTSDSTSFVNAAVLVAFADAKNAGLPSPPEEVVKRALDSTKRQRLPDFSYLYGEYLKEHPVMGINRPGGSLGRSQACNIALRLWGDEKVTDEVLIVWLDRLFARNGWLGMGRKRPVPHESWMQVAGYFYYFGHYYAARCIDELPKPERDRQAGYLAHTLLPLQEKDGSWWDYPLYDYHQTYGTSFAIMSLVRTLK